MSENNVPLNEEHMEAVQNDLDKRRYEYIASLSEEDKGKFKKMEECVETLIGLDRPFFLFVAPEKDKDDKFWRYQKVSSAQPPFDEKESNEVMKRSWYAMLSHANLFAKMTGYVVQFQSKAGVPFYQVRDEGDIRLSVNTKSKDNE